MLHRHNGRDSAQDDQYGLWSATELAKAYIRDGNEPAAEQAVNEMTARFAEQETLSTELARIGDTYAQAGKYDVADQLYKYIREHWSDAEDTLWAKAGQIRLHIINNEDAAAEGLFQRITADYANDVSLPQIANLIGEEYYRRALTAQKRLIEAEIADSSLNQSLNGPCESARRDFQKAITKWETVTDILPETASVTVLAHHYAGRAYYALGDHSNAMRHYEKAASRQDFEDADYALLMIGRCLDKMATQGSISREEADGRAKPVYEALLSRFPASGYARLATSKLEQTARRNQLRLEGD